MTLTVKQARQLKGWTQKRVAAELGVHRQTFSKWESNPDEMPVGKAKQFSKLVDRSVDEIFFIA
ncbi:helix-turn-helix transcriptional regulator [Paenibacillus lycopersici]|uniref:Helix-turn-helix transcriptional regulator n=1 Tax=Paenibacillus lycopersici TaxID=2704462 RepID=A0A6C0G1G2_9BACL|nr:helix-turn-helix transcriptional regulator [Paenibacillus lycopersici]QHT61733.1 helix-turn-helix transcriptional regulator [Paenibacillus lycopersici]